MTEDRPSIEYETGLDEAFLLGTRDEIRSFVQKLLEAVDAIGSPSDFHGIPVRQIAEPFTEPMGEVVLDGIVVVESKHDRQEITNRIRVNNGDLPVDWEGAETHWMKCQ